MSAWTEEDTEGFTITFRREILFYLRQLINDGDPISVIFNEGRDTILTILLDVDEEQGTLVLDWGSSDEVNQRFLNCDRNFFVATPQGVRNQFIAGKPWPVTYKKRPAFAVRLPKKYVRLQRRNYFRLALPMTQRPICTLALSEGPARTFSVLDIGLGGVSLEIAADRLPCEIGEVIASARIDLNAIGELNVALEVRHMENFTRGTKSTLRLGCQFEHLSPAQEQLLQKFITTVQREERARLGN